MKTILPIYFYAAIIIFLGIFLLLSGDSNIDTIKLMMGGGMTTAGIFAIFASVMCNQKPVQCMYHKIHSSALLVYGVIILFFCRSMDMLIFSTSILLVFYSFSEIIFCMWLFDLGKRIVYKALVLRLLVALLIGIGVAIAMNLTSITLEIYGAFLILIGINFLFYVPIMQKKMSENRKSGHRTKQNY